MTYKPLPEYLTIKESLIEGLGLFTNKDIKKWTVLGESHFYHKGKLKRTPLGGFYNHSENPNTRKISIGKRWFIIAIRDIEKGEEITVKYTLYKLKDE